jgi:hypothetical protein
MAYRDEYAATRINLMLSITAVRMPEVRTTGDPSELRSHFKTPAKL